MRFNNSDILLDFGSFFRNLMNDITSGLLFFGGPVDILIAILDILATAYVIHYILKILRDTRAWQLLKGLALIVGLAFVFSLLGLTTVGFMLNNTISVLAIAFVVIFQPELRRALETVGRSSFSRLSSALSADDSEQTTRSIHHMIEAIVRACDKMAETQTGALIIIERTTRLGEFAEQENAVQLDAAVSSTMLQQIFYKGSPLHDGAVLIRNGRINAARVHVPLSDNYHLRRDYGTRHRAAIGASEIGDTLAIVVSEERGSISLALEGRLFVLDNADALRSLLHKILGQPRHGTTWTGLFKPRREDLDPEAPIEHAENTQPVKSSAESARALIEAELLRQKSVQEQIANMAASKNARHRLGLFTNRGQTQESAGKYPRWQRILTALTSLLIAMMIWLYVQVSINPVETRTYSVQVSYRGVEIAQANGYVIQMPIETVQISLMGRKKNVSSLSAGDVTAYIDVSKVAQTGLTTLPIEVDTSNVRYMKTTMLTPSTLMLNVRATETD